MRQGRVTGRARVRRTWHTHATGLRQSAASRSALESTTFENPSAERVTVVMNRMDELVDYALTVGDKEVNASIPQHAM